MVEAARRYAPTGCLVCLIGFIVVLVFAYWVGPSERLDRSVLDALSTSTDTVINHIAYVGFQVVNFKPFWVLMGAVAVLIALSQWRIREAVIAAALIAGTGGLDLALKALLAHPRYQPIPVGSDAFPSKDAFPSGHSAGSLAISLAFLTVVPSTWQRATAAVGAVFTLYISLGVLVLNYHYPSDVLAGWLLAAGLWFALLLTLASPYRPRPGAGQRRLSRPVPYAGRGSG